MFMESELIRRKYVALHISNEHIAHRVAFSVYMCIYTEKNQKRNLFINMDNIS